MNRYRVAAFFWTLIMLAVSITPGNMIEPVGRIQYSSIVAHFGEFIVLGYLLSRAFPTFRNPFLISLFYAVFTEVLQLYVPGRFFSYSDILLNIIGSLFGICAHSTFTQSHIFLQFKNKLGS